MQISTHKKSLGFKLAFKTQIATALLLSTFVPHTLAAEAQIAPAPNLAVKAYLLKDLNSGFIIAEQQGNMRVEPASLTKIMTAYLSFKALKNGHLKLTQTLPVSEAALKVEGSRMFIEPRIQMCIRDRANLTPHQLQRLAVPLYILGVILLIAVALFGSSSKGAQRWLNLGFIKIQPSELMRIAMPMMLAWYFAKCEGRPYGRDFAAATLLLVIPVGLIKIQPDLGTCLLYTSRCV